MFSSSKNCFGEQLLSLLNFLRSVRHDHDCCSKMAWLTLLFIVYAHQVVESAIFTNGSKQALDHSRMACEKDWYSFNGKCYKVGGLEYSKLPWDKAADFCREDGGSLVVIHNKETQDFVKLIVLELKMNVWIGLHDRVSESIYKWVDESAVTYTNWQPGEPSGYKNKNEDCVEMIFETSVGESGQWNDLTCDSHIPFICQKDQINYSVLKAPKDPIFCPEEGSSGYKFHNSCYNLVTEKKTWQEAESYCRSEYFGHLVSVRDFSVDLFLDFVLKELREEIWVGISIKEDFTQKWSNGFFVGYNGWRKGKKDFVEGTCATRNGSRQWGIADCTRKFAFVCEKTVDMPTTLTPTVKGSVCPKTPDGWRDLGGDMCYYFELEKMVTWHEANFDCMFRGGNLASLHSEEESKVIHQFVLYTKGALFFGLHRRFQGGKDFAWSDKSKLDWLNWNPGEPNFEKESCSELMTNNMKWNDIGCDIKRGYICSIRKIAPSTNVTITVEGFLGDGHCSKCSCGPISIVLFCITAVLVLFGAISCYYFKPWNRKKHRRLYNASLSILSESSISSFKQESFPERESKDSREHCEIPSMG